MKKIQFTHKIASILTTAALLGTSFDASAQTTLTSVTDNLTKSASGLPKMISTVAYIGGVGLGVAGIYKLKEHVEKPGNVTMKEGLVRLGAGGGLLALPYITSAMTGSVSADGTANVNFSTINDSFDTSGM